EKPKLKTIASKKITLNILEPPAPVVVVKAPVKVEKKPPAPLTGNVKFTSLPEEMLYNTTHLALISVENTSDRTAQFSVFFNIAGPSGEQKAFTSPVTLSSAEITTVQFNFNFSDIDSDGQYFAIAELREYPDNRLIQTDSFVLPLIDQPPVVEFRDIFISPANKHTFEVVSSVEDDRGVSAVYLHYNDLNRNYTTTYNMSLTTGDTKSGLWSHSFIPYKKSKDFRFYIEALDSKNNSSKTDENLSITAIGVRK
ncbi:MAG: hypothetical protein AB1633_12500, partial [Elusimicrobiota bacterium]